ncbi:MAG: hypothetical protein WCT04_28055, partial [Planctomycetota bacterium]
LGNYIHRVVTFSVNKLNATIPDATYETDSAHAAFAAETQTALSNSAAQLDGYQFRNAMATIMTCARAGNVYFDSNAPWKSLKTDVPECHRVIRNCLERVAAIGLMLRPFLPKSAAAILANFGVKDAFAANSASWLPADVVKTGGALEKPTVLFKKLEPADMPQIEA